MGYYNKFDLKDLDGHWQSVLADFGFNVTNKAGLPCPFCGGTDRFQYTNIHNNGTFICRNCTPKNGTGFIYLQKALNKSGSEVIKMLAEKYGRKENIPKKKEFVPKMPDLKDAIIPAPHDLKYVPNTYLSVLSQKNQKPYSFQYQILFPWKTIDNQLVGYIGRKADKVCHQIFWTDKGWTQGSLGTGRPLFGLETLSKDPKILYVVEGEKTCIAVQEATDMPVVTWTGGASAYGASDWTVVKNREVVLCPDNDDPGFKAMEGIKKLLQGSNTIINFKPPSDKPPGWDLADEDLLDVAEIIESNLINEEEIREQQEEIAQEKQKSLLQEIRPLGFDKDKLYFLPSGKLQVIEMSANSLCKGHLRALTDIDNWAKSFPKDSIVDPVNWDQAANWVIRECEKKKVYDLTNIRGNGIWLDNNQTVIHMGDHLIVDQKRIELNKIDSKFVYAQRPRKLSLPPVELSKYEKELLVRIAKSLNWAESTSANMLLSFLIAAPLAGRLHWRPSIWINGEAGAGKTTVLEKFIKPCLSGLYIDVEGDTTEAGLRQLIGCDALPVLFDEPEADSVKACESLQRLIRFIRSCASSSSAMIVKGSSNQSAVRFQAQCMFLLASINVIAMQKQDRDRISILELRPNKEDHALEQWASLETMLDTIPLDISSKLIDFIIKNTDWILKVIKAFCTYVAKKTGSQRVGDQYGILSIGEYILMNTPGKMPSEEDMSKYITNQMWGTIKTNNQETNEKDFLSFVANILLQIEDDADGKRKELSLREAFDIAAGKSPFVFSSMKNNVIAALGRRGMQVKDDEVSFIRNSHNLLKLFAEKPQFSNYIGILKRLPGAQERRIRIQGEQFYAIGIPLKLFGQQDWLKGEPEDEKELINDTEIPW